MKRFIESVRGIATHIHIPVGVILRNFLLIMAVTAWSTSLLSAAWLPAGRTANWRIESLVWGATIERTFQLTDCHGFGPLPTFTLKPGGVIKAEPYLCSNTLGIVEAPAGVESASHLIFDDGTNHVSYVVPALEYGDHFLVTPILNDGGTGAWLNVYATEPTTLTWTVYDGGAQEIGQGYFSALAGWNQFRIPTPVSAGSLALSAGCVGFGPCPSHPFLGFVSNTDDRGGNADVRVLK